MNAKKFSEIKVDIQNAISQRISQLLPQGEAGFTLIDGFFNFPVQDQVGSGLIIGGPTIPMVAIMGNTSGRVFFFPVKVLIPNFDK